ncbi:glycosyltransferase [Neoaquamicrobium sediminum]|uniref:glycosyltransferase n=1 Tax=Neoaquamicrobium sediminum TaxID=1849104 RepID=UPI003BAA11F5
MPSAKTNNAPVISVVICFRNWGVDRLVASVRLHLRHSTDLPTEVIVSDYGSSDPDSIRDAVEAAGGRVVRSETTDLPWSRSAALNAGVEMAAGRYIITTDADIIFSPACYSAAVSALELNPESLCLVQCRDLPPASDVHFFEKLLDCDEPVDFVALRDVSSLRPRWGMGGFAAFTREAFFVLNGYEERMKVWGKEDTDFAQRFAYNRMPARWLSHEKCSIFHIWHESSSGKARSNADTNAQLEENQKILDHDFTQTRNLDRGFSNPIPLVSIVLPTHKRPAYLRQALQSCQSQTFRNFEVIVIENGDSDCSARTVSDMADPRFRYFKIEEAGVAVARNFGNALARGRYILIMDDDDIMVSTRIADHLRAMEGGRFHGSYGGWIDFDDISGEAIGFHPGKDHSFAAMYSTGRVIVHAGLMLERKLFQQFKYDESKAAGVDFGLLFMMTYLGLRLAHTGKFCLLRRMHDTNMTIQRSAIQKASAVEAVAAIQTDLSEERKKQLRAEGAQTKELQCDNRQSALAELSVYFNGGRLPPVNGAASVVGSDVRYDGLAESSVAEEFDSDWYISAYPDVKLSGMDPRYHFERFGILLGRQGRSNST